MKTKYSRIVMTVFLLIGIITASAAFALTLSQVKSQGLVGEQPNGYLGIVVSNPSPQVNQLVNSVNAKRKGSYQAIANQNGTSLQAVEKIAGQTAIQKTSKGDYIKTASGQWVKK